MARGCRLKSKQKNQVSHGTTHIRAACIAHVLNTLRNVVRSGGGGVLENASFCLLRGAKPREARLQVVYRRDHNSRAGRVGTSGGHTYNPTKFASLR